MSIKALVSPDSKCDGHEQGMVYCATRKRNERKKATTTNVGAGNKVSKFMIGPKNKRVTKPFITHIIELDIRGLKIGHYNSTSLNAMLFYNFNQDAESS